MLQILLFGTVLSIHTVISAQVTLSNVEPRLDTKGNILNAHDGVVQQWEPNGKFYWYSIGYSECTEPSGANGCSVAGVNNSCGFQYNHSVNLYVSSDLTSGSWQFIANVLPLQNRPTGIMWTPTVVFNANTQEYVLFANYLPTNDFSTSLYFAATSPSQEGPFVTRNTMVNLTNPQPGDGKLFVDDDGTGYYVYTSIAMNHQMVVEQLSADFLSSTGIKSNLMTGGCLEAPSMLKHDTSGLYFVFASTCCCYCGEGGDVAVFVAEQPLGPFRMSSYINDKRSNGKGDIIISAQQTNVIAVNTTGGAREYLWIGDRWQTAPGGIKAYDYTYWGPLVFESNGTKVQQMQWRDNFTIALDV